MRAKAKAENLLRCFQVAMHALSSTAKHLDLKKVYVRFLEGTIEATCTDGDFFVCAKCEAEVHEPGEALFIPEQIVPFLECQDPERDVFFETKMAISNPDIAGKIVISGQDEAEADIWAGQFFPQVVLPEKLPGYFRLTDDALKSLLVSGTAATPSSDSNFTPQAKNMSIFQDGSTVYLTTADVRLSVAISDGDGIPVKGVLAPLRYVGKAKSATGADTVEVSENHLVMHGESAWARFGTDGSGSAINPAKYIHFPEDPVAVVSFGKELADRLSLCQVFGGERSAAAICYDPEGHANISTFIKTFRGQRVSATPGQPAWEQAFSALYLQDALRDLGLDTDVEILPFQGSTWARIRRDGRVHIFMSMVPPK